MSEIVDFFVRPFDCDVVVLRRRACQDDFILDDFELFGLLLVSNIIRLNSSQYLETFGALLADVMSLCEDLPFDF